MHLPSTQTVFVLAILLHSSLAFSQNPDCPQTTFFKTLGTETQTEYGTVLSASSDGNLYLAGRNGLRSFIQKTNPAGEVIWMREFQVGPFESVTPIQIFEDSEGMIVGCGTQNLFAGATRGFVFRYDPVANTFLWTRSIASSNPLAAGILEKTPGSSYVYYQNLTLPDGETDIEILDLERATGQIIPAFARRYEHISYDVLTKMIAVNGSLYGLGAAESVDSFSNAKRRLMLARFDPVNGMPLWAQLSHEGASAATDFLSRDLIADGDALLAAYIVDEDINDMVNTQPHSIHLQKTDLDGNILWIKKYDSLTTSILRVISVPDGYVLSGQRTDNNRYFVFKVDKDGEFVWGRNLTYGPSASTNTLSLGPNQSVAMADSLYFTGLATTGLGDVFFWKTLSDGSMTDSCGYVDTLVLEAIDISNPVATPITLQHLLSTAITTTLAPQMNSNTLVETLVCPDCTDPDPCPEHNDFAVLFGGIDCVNGQIQMSLSYCDLYGDPPSEGLNITFYNANPFTGPADKLLTFTHDSVSSTIIMNCASLLLTDLENLFGPDAIQNGAQIFAVVNDPGDFLTPYSLDDFPISNLAECDYSNNIDSLTVQLPAAPTLNLGTDQTICANEQATFDAGAGFFKYQWSNGASTQAINANFAGSYRVTVTDACGFRQIDTINLQVTPLPIVTENASFCPGKSVTVRGFTFDQVGTFQKTIPGINGDCDTSATFFISLLPYEEKIEVINFCPFETVTINGVTYEDSGLVRDTVPAAVGCDTVIFYFLNQLPLPFRNIHFDICPGDSVVFNGNVYYQFLNITDTLYSTGFGCDTIVFLSIDVLPQNEVSETVQFCPGSSVDIGGQTYTQPGMVSVTIPSTNGGCDTLLTYTLEWLPAPEREETVEFCPGESVDIGGQTYTQPGTVQLTIPGNGSTCDTLVTYTLSWLPSPTRSETVEFCEGESISIGGQSYTQPGTVMLTIPGSNGTCDTLVTYTLQFLVPPPSNLTLTCPPAVNIATIPGTGPIPVNYTLPSVSSDCICPGTGLNLTSGIASGGIFPVANTEVCYAAQDSCGASAQCCFTITVREEQPCDTKIIGCMKYEILSITSDPQQQYTYNIRVTNNCSNKLLYTAIELPNGVTAVAPANLSTYTSPEGRNYVVRNPNYSPFYSIRFKSTTDSIVNGESDVFAYTLPAQSHPTFIHVISRLAPQVFYEAKLNTFNCPIGSSNSQQRSEEFSLLENPQTGILLFPNPSNGELFADLSRWQGQDLKIQILDSRGARVQSFMLNAGSEAQAIPLASRLSSGLYFLEIATEGGEKEVARFVLER